MFLIVPSQLNADPLTISYGGRLVNSDGSPVAGPIDLEFSFFRTSGAATPLGTDPYSINGVVLSQGVFQVSITFSAADLNSIFESGDLDTYIRVSDLTNGITYPVQRFSHTPLALRVPIDTNTLKFDSNGKLTVGELPQLDLTTASLAQVERSAHLRPLCRQVILSESSTMPDQTQKLLTII